MNKHLGIHCLLELYGCPPHLLNDLNHVRQTLVRATEVATAQLLDDIHHTFEPQGITALGLLSESHISIHTWPEHGFVAADVFTCGTSANPEAACHFLIDAMGACEHTLQTLYRGDPKKLHATEKNLFPKAPKIPQLKPV